MEQDFKDLSYQTQVRRLRALALNALAAYDLPVQRLSLIQHAYNTVFRVDTSDGQRYVLRVNWPGGRQLAEIYAEMRWLAALTRDTDLHIPPPVAARNGELVVTAEAKGVPEPRHCVVFGWVPGRHLRKKLPQGVVCEMGRTLATLHDHADTFQPPDGFWLKKHNQIEHFGTPPQLHDGPSELFPAPRRELFLEGLAKTQAVIDRLYEAEDGLRVVHADLHLGNVKWHQGQLQVFDFDDCTYAFPVQDIGISFCYLQYRPDYRPLWEEFLAGYTELRTSPEEYEGQLWALAIGRHLEVLNFVLMSDNPQMQALAPHLLGMVEHRLREWLAS